MSLIKRAFWEEIQNQQYKEVQNNGRNEDGGDESECDEQGD